MTSWILPSVLSVHAFTTLSMTGLIWVIQLVHYPLFARVGESAFQQYAFEHTRRITWLVGPLMLIEGVTACSLVILVEQPLLRAVAAVGLALLLLIWSSTAFLQVPCHTRLGHGLDPAILRRLVNTNWIRTAAWSARGAIALVLLRRVF